MQFWNITLWMKDSDEWNSGIRTNRQTQLHRRNSCRFRRPTRFWVTLRRRSAMTNLGQWMTVHRWGARTSTTNSTISTASWVFWCAPKSINNELSLFSLEADSKTISSRSSESPWGNTRTTSSTEAGNSPIWCSSTLPTAMPASTSSPCGRNWLTISNHSVCLCTSFAFGRETSACRLWNGDYQCNAGRESTG